MSPQADNHEPEIGRETLEQAATLLEAVPAENPLAAWSRSIAAYIRENLNPDPARLDHEVTPASGQEAPEARSAPREHVATPEEAEHYYRVVSAASEPLLLFVHSGEWSDWAAISRWGRWSFEEGDVPADLIAGAEEITAEEAAVQLVTGPAEVVQFLDRKAWLEEGRPAAQAGEFPTMPLAEWRREELQPILDAKWPVRMEPYGPDLAVVVAGPAPRPNADPGGVFCWLMRAEAIVCEQRRTA